MNCGIKGDYMNKIKIVVGIINNFNGSSTKKEMFVDFVEAKRGFLRLYNRQNGEDILVGMINLNNIIYWFENSVVSY